MTITHIIHTFNDSAIILTFSLLSDITSMRCDDIPGRRVATISAAELSNALSTNVLRLARACRLIRVQHSYLTVITVPEIDILRSYHEYIDP